MKYETPYQDHKLNQCQQCGNTWYSRGKRGGLSRQCPNPTCRSESVTYWRKDQSEDDNWQINSSQIFQLILLGMVLLVPVVAVAKYQLNFYNTQVVPSLNQS